MSVKIKHQIIYIKANGEEQKLIDQLSEYDITHDQLEEPITQMGLMDLEDELIKSHIKVQRVIYEDTPEDLAQWDKEFKEANEVNN